MIIKGNLVFACVLLIISCNSHKDSDKYNHWGCYGGNHENNHYSSLTVIDTNNVAGLKQAWIFRTGDADSMTQIQTNPVVVNGTLFAVSPKLKLFALDAATGTKKWVFNPFDSVVTNAIGNTMLAEGVCRSVTYYKNSKDDDKVFYTAGSIVYCLDVATGKLSERFGNKGTLDLHNDLGRDVSDFYVVATSPGVIYKDVYIIGCRVAEQAKAAPGYIRAYDVNTGKLRWVFHTIPHPGEFGYESWDDKEAYKNVGGANAWAGFSLDVEKGILFAPTGSASFDFYGAMRKGNNLFANSLIAIDALTGKRIWHFQTVHHDIWDRDLPTAPILATIKKDGKEIEAVVQVTKTGFIYLFDRQTGKPLYPVEEKQVPVSGALPGEKASPTQPYPTFPAPFIRQHLSDDDINPFVTTDERNKLKQQLIKTRREHMFTPPSMEGTLIFPGYDGGAEWGGAAYDPQTGIMYVNANEMAWILTMIETKNKGKEKELVADAGKRLYRANCMTCHGPDKKGSGNNPALIDISKKYSAQQISQLITSGRRMMPAMPSLTKEEKNAIISWVTENKMEQQKKYTGKQVPSNPYHNMPYNSTGYHKFLTADGYPAIAPPWGTLNAINLHTGKPEWKIPLGEYPALTAKGIPPTGTENYGGPAVTAGGVLFIAASRDGKFRAFNKRTGKLLWQTNLPAPGFATPSVYNVNGKQYVVIACGGGKLKTHTSDSYIAFALP